MHGESLSTSRRRRRKNHLIMRPSQKERREGRKEERKERSQDPFLLLTSLRNFSEYSEVLGNRYLVYLVNHFI